MGVDFCLACADCYEVIDLHKWPVVKSAGQFLVDAHFKPEQYPGQLRVEDSPYPFVDLETHCKKVLVTAEQVEDALAGKVPNQAYISELTPIVRTFAARHREHRLFLSCDLGDPEDDPWWPGRPGFADWLALPGPVGFNKYLPRNLIEVAGYRTWSAVLAGMTQEWPFELAEYFTDEIEAIRTAFEERRTNYSK